MRNWDDVDDPPPPGVALGEMTEDDLEDVLRIENLSFASPWTRAQLVAVLDGPAARNLVLRRRGRTVAYACSTVAADELEIQNVAVDPAERGRGLAKRLLRAILDEAGRRGCRYAHLEVRPSNETALALYRGLGFRPTGRRRGYYVEPKEDAILMTARLHARGIETETEDE